MARTIVVSFLCAYALLTGTEVEVEVNGLLTYFYDYLNMRFNALCGINSSSPLSCTQITTSRGPGCVAFSLGVKENKEIG